MSEAFNCFIFPFLLNYLLIGEGAISLFAAFSPCLLPSPIFIQTFFIILFYRYCCI